MGLKQKEELELWNKTYKEILGTDVRATLTEFSFSDDDKIY